MNEIQNGCIVEQLYLIAWNELFYNIAIFNWFTGI